MLFLDPLASSGFTCVCCHYVNADLFFICLSQKKVLPSFHFLVSMCELTSCFSTHLLPSSDGVQRHHMQCVFTVFLPFSIVSFLHNFCTFFSFLYNKGKETSIHWSPCLCCLYEIDTDKNWASSQCWGSGFGKRRGRPGCLLMFATCMCVCFWRRRRPAGRAC